jgi:hypothetical protein
MSDEEMVVIPHGGGYWDDAFLEAMEKGWRYLFTSDYEQFGKPGKDKILLVATTDGTKSWSVGRTIKKCFADVEHIHDRVYGVPKDGPRDTRLLKITDLKV